MLTGQDVSPSSAHERSAATSTACKSDCLQIRFPVQPGVPTRIALDGALAVCGLNLSKESDEALMLVRVRRQRGYVLGESSAAPASLECLGRDVLSILLVGKKPAKERLAVLGREPAKLEAQPGIGIRQ